ncbi:MAG TPA: LemA family protein [Bacteroidota bacterium]|nr:LemA family protein [Bacteroidota bacterium]
MSKTAITILGILGVILLIGFSCVSWYTRTYNGFVALDENVKQSWGEVGVQYQRRNDLIPNLVETVKGFATHESDVFTQVAEARSSVGKLTVTPEVLNDPALFQKFEAAQGAMSSALSRLLAVSENYPQLKANENFLQLQSQLEGTENRISVARKRFNEAVQGYNTALRMFPASFIANMSGFQAKPYFQAEAGAEKAPTVKF